MVQAVVTPLAVVLVVATPVAAIQAAVMLVVANHEDERSPIQIRLAELRLGDDPPLQ